MSAVLILQCFNKLEREISMNYLTVEPWNEPRAIFDNELDFEPMMSQEEHGFLCAMLKQKEAKKIIELGVAAGGTTAVIMAALKILDRDSKVYSVDLSEKYYVDTRYETGYLYNRYKDKIDCQSTHIFLLGKTIAEQVESEMTEG